MNLSLFQNMWSNNSTAIAETFTKYKIPDGLDGEIAIQDCWLFFRDVFESNSMEFYDHKNDS